MTNIHTNGKTANPPCKTFEQLEIGDWFITQGQIAIKVNESHAFFIKNASYCDLRFDMPAHLIIDLNLEYKSIPNK